VSNLMSHGALNSLFWCVSNFVWSPVSSFLACRVPNSVPCRVSHCVSHCVPYSTSRLQNQSIPSRSRPSPSYPHVATNCSGTVYSLFGNIAPINARKFTFLWALKKWHVLRELG
jgi:hypothetical protein